MEWLKKPWVKLGIRISGFLFLIGATAFTIAYFTTDIPDPNEYVNSQSTIIQFSDGDEVGRIGAQNRTIVPLAGVPQDLRRAVLAAEDKGFYSQGAFNPLAILRGAINTALGRGLQGGSTITQQYAKTAFLTPDRTIQRKIIELIVAIKLEPWSIWRRDWSKGLFRQECKPTHHSASCSSSSDIALPWLLRSGISRGK
jgi:membrane peptidoglycan carboxypeptidase